MLLPLHHLPLEAALRRLKILLRPGGVLAVIGLYRLQSATDYASAALALPASHFLRAIRPAPGISAPLRDPELTLADIRAACRLLQAVVYNAGDRYAEALEMPRFMMLGSVDATELAHRLSHSWHPAGEAA